MSMLVPPADVSSDSKLLNIQILEYSIFFSSSTRVLEIRNLQLKNMEEITLNEFQTSVCGGLDDSCSCSDQFSNKNEDLIKNLIKIFFIKNLLD